MTGTAGNPITIQADPNATPGSVIINSRNNETRVGIDLEPGCNYITIKGITVDGSSGLITSTINNGYGIKITGNYDQLIGNTVQNMIGACIAGIHDDGGNNAVIQGNTITGVQSGGDGKKGHGIYVADATGVQVIGNSIHDNAYIGIHIDGDPNTVSNALIADNVIYNNGQNGINADGLQNSTIVNNLIYNYAGNGICLYYQDSSGPSLNNIIVNNTIYSGTSSGTGGSIRILDASTGNTILNNILLDSSAIVYRISADSQSGTISNYNVVPSGAQIRSEDTALNESFSQWQSQSGQDKNSLSATPAQLFVNASGNDYHLSSTSPAIDVGTSTDAPSTDIAGNPRPSGKGYDIGAYEYQGSPTTAASPPPATPPPATPPPAAASSTSSMWSSTAKPANTSDPDSASVELGVKFYSDVSGFITGLRFYKGITNTGTHVADLWTSSGTLLATATFTSETGSGWQQVNFTSPVAITAGTTYVASYHTNVGHYADDQNYFASQYNSGSLHVPVNGGVYAYGGAGSFPTQVWNASNYWVDIVFSPSAGN